MAGCRRRRRANANPCLRIGNWGIGVRLGLGRCGLFLVAALVGLSWGAIHQASRAEEIGGVGWVALEGCGRRLVVWTKRVHSLHWANLFLLISLNFYMLNIFSSPVHETIVEIITAHKLVTLFFRKHPNSNRD